MCFQHIVPISESNFVFQDNVSLLTALAVPEQAGLEPTEILLPLVSQVLGLKA